MFKLIALLFHVTNGVPAVEAYYTMPNNNYEFPSKEACQEFLTTDQGKATTGFVEKWVAGQEGEITVKFDCIAKGESI